MSAAPRIVLALSLCSCSASSSATTADAGPPAWRQVLHDLAPSLLSVWGTGAGDVFAAGGTLGNGGPPALLRYDGASWKNLAPTGTGTFWWTHGTSAADVWAVGTGGRVVHWDGAHLVDHASGTTATLYGVWAASPTDVWIVGGTPEGGASQPNDVLLHFDGTSLTPATLPTALGRTFFKVWGTSSTNLYVVGEYGTIWHRVGATWSLEASQPPLATGNLTTVAGCSATEVYAVGGQDVLVSDGKTWSRAGATVVNGGVNGVSCSRPGQVVLVGFGGFKQRLVRGVWIDDTASSPTADLHGAWADPAGGFWAAGGDFISQPQAAVSRAGVLGYLGTESIGGSITP